MNVRPIAAGRHLISLLFNVSYFKAALLGILLEKLLCGPFLDVD